MGTIYIGMDMHKSFIQAAAMDEKGTIVAEERIGTEAEDIGRFAGMFSGMEIKAAIEAPCAWHNIYEILESLGIETVLVNSRRTKAIAEAKIKTDSLDAKTIAHCLRTGFIAKSWIPPKQIRDLRCIMRHRLSLGIEITRYKNRVHSILLRNGIKHEYSDLFGKAGMEFLESLELQGAELYRLQSNLNIVKVLEAEKKSVAKKINQLCKADEQAMLLTSIKGIGYYSAMIIMAEIGDMQRFPNPKKLCSYAGLVPRTMQSGSHVYHGRLIRECNQNLKWILNQCAHVHNRRCRDSPIARVYYRMVRRGKGSNKATVAASRKMLTCIWHMLTKGEEFKGR